MIAVSGFEDCPACHGTGKVSIGRHIAFGKVRKCPVCLGKGRIEVLDIESPEG